MPEVRWRTVNDFFIGDRRWVKVWSAAGIKSGIDLAAAFAFITWVGEEVPKPDKYA